MNQFFYNIAVSIRVSEALMVCNEIWAVIVRVFDCIVDRTCVVNVFSSS